MTGVQTCALPIFSGYLTVWIICGLGALVAAVLLFFVPKLAFADIAEDLPASTETASVE